MFCQRVNGGCGVPWVQLMQVGEEEVTAYVPGFDFEAALTLEVLYNCSSYPAPPAPPFRSPFHFPSPSLAEPKPAVLCSIPSEL